MAKNTGEVREKSGNFVSPEKWEPCRFLSYAEMGSRDPSPSLCNVNMFCIKQCSHEVWIQYPSPAI